MYFIVKHILAYHDEIRLKVETSQEYHRHLHTQSDTGICYRFRVTTDICIMQTALDLIYSFIY